MAKKGERGLRQDDAGVWWHHFGDGRRMRAKKFACARCGTTFWSWRAKRFCSGLCQHVPNAEWIPANQVCAFCGQSFSGKTSQRFCSHECAARSMHAGRTVTTPETDAMDLVNGNNPRYNRDENGQWWYLAGARGDRTRAYVRRCPRCQRPFLYSIFHSKGEHCSKSCGLRALYDAHPGKRKGEKSPAWRGGKQMRRGYVWTWCPDHPSRSNTAKAYVLEHRLVMEKHLGRYLTRDEHVHHINGIRDDNRIENLELWTHAHPSGIRVRDMEREP
jgi:HNH endonuclease